MARQLGARAFGEAEVTGLSLNTSDVVAGDLYAALPGSTTHGGRYAPQAVSEGAVAVLTDAAGLQCVPDDTPYIVLEDPRAALPELAAELYDHPSKAFTTIGITGTQGKTTSTYLAEAALGAERSAVIGTIGTRVGGVPARSALTTPEAPALQALFAVMREEEIEVCAMEVSSHALAQGRVDGFVFDVGVFLNLGRDHLDFHADMEEYFAAKASLLTSAHAHSGVVVVDDEYGRRLATGATVPITTVSTRGEPADWRAVDIVALPHGTEARLLGPEAVEVELFVPLPGAFNVANAAAVLAALTVQGHDPHEIARGIAESPGVPGRMERVDAGQDFTAVVDYAHKPDAVVAVLDALRPVTPGRIIVVIGAGGDRDHGKRPLMGAAAARHADVVIVTDDNPRTEEPAAIRAAVLRGTRKESATVMEIGGRQAAIAEAVTMAGPGDTVVVAGKGHERGQEIAGVVHPFDDRDVLRACLEARA
ncbi:UDP-N-acetylmuramoyl-L-alanyl-D-glutamate--2,6-diaminopimelate ligase [Aeromicrobium phragmitis]|uniref:UDP-N-acetylmuramoyl-L-alanyl-D-glutamate--2, 6-diaminopimelate ligase n=1 Tax=Aeromicrobium phragmitis TaxID=2478914 RepID=UPI003C7BF6C2